MCSLIFSFFRLCSILYLIAFIAPTGGAIELIASAAILFVCSWRSLRTCKQVPSTAHCKILFLHQPTFQISKEKRRNVVCYNGGCILSYEVKFLVCC